MINSSFSVNKSGQWNHKSLSLSGPTPLLLDQSDSHFSGHDASEGNITILLEGVCSVANTDQVP